MSRIYYTLRMETIKIVLYTSTTEKQPFADWLRKLDSGTKTIVAARLARIKANNFGDCKRIVGSSGVHELRIDHGTGYRIYYGKKGTTIVVLLVGGNKGSQNRDIAKAKQYWLDFKEQKYD